MIPIISQNTEGETIHEKIYFLSFAGSGSFRRHGTLTLSVQDITVYRRGLPTRIHSDNGVFAIRLDNCEGVFVTIG